MPCAILCDIDEHLVYGWSMDENDAAMARLGAVHEKPKTTASH